jgi:hypothetical protein
VLDAVERHGGETRAHDDVTVVVVSRDDEGARAP